MTILQKKFYFEEGVCDQLAAFSKTTRLSQSWIVENILTQFFKTNPKDFNIILGDPDALYKDQVKKISSRTRSPAKKRRAHAK
tara:strand:- start:333 stop:581 length:249 start_codon:yes stop_codon:yes gene_type:complete